MQEFQTELLSRIDRFLDLLERAFPAASVAAVSKEESSSTDLVKSRERELKDKVSDDTFTRLAPLIVEHVFSEETSVISDLSEMLGVSTPTIVRIVKRLQAESFLASSGGEITLTDTEAAVRWLDKLQSSRDFGELDAYTRRQISKALKVLLRDDIIRVGRVTRSLAEDLGVQRAACERLVRTMSQDLGFVARGATGSSGGLIRIRPSQIEAARRFVAEVDSVPEEHAPDWAADSVSDKTFAERAPAVVDYMLESESGIPFNVICEKASIQPNMLRAVLIRLHRHEGVVIGVSEKNPVHPQRVRLVEPERAESWLAEKTAPASPVHVN